MNYKFKTKPYGHQLDALDASWDKENFAYFMEMGTGKSKVLLDNASKAILQNKKEIDFPGANTKRSLKYIKILEKWRKANI